MQALKISQCEISKEEKFEYSKFILQKLLPFLRRFSAEQVMEKETEAKLEGSIILFKIGHNYCLYFSIDMPYSFHVGNCKCAFTIRLGNIYLHS